MISTINYFLILVIRVILLLKLAGDLRGIPKGQMLGQCNKWSLCPLSAQLRLPSIYKISPMGGDLVCVGSLMKDKSMDMSDSDIPFPEFEG